MMPRVECSGGESEGESIRAAARVVAAGGVVVYPTETLYGLGVDACNIAAVQRLVELKGREAGKPIAVLVSDVAMLDEFVSEIPVAADALMRRFWPGPLTIVLRARPSVSALLTGGGGGIGVRWSSHTVATALVRVVGKPITAPSANPAGRRPPVRIEEAQAYFGERVDAYIDAGALRGEPASTVIDLRAQPRVIRAGAVAVQDLRASLGQVVASSW